MLILPLERTFILTDDNGHELAQISGLRTAGRKPRLTVQTAPGICVLPKPLVAHDEAPVIPYPEGDPPIRGIFDGFESFRKVLTTEQLTPELLVEEFQKLATDAELDPDGEPVIRLPSGEAVQVLFTGASWFWLLIIYEFREASDELARLRVVNRLNRSAVAVFTSPNIDLLAARQVFDFTTTGFDPIELITAIDEFVANVRAVLAETDFDGLVVLPSPEES